MVEDALAQTQALGGDLQDLVVGQELQALLQGENARGHQAQGLVGAGGAHIGQLLFAADVDGDVLHLGTHAHHHALIHGHAGADEQSATVLGGKQAVGHGLAGLVGHQGAGVAPLDLALVGHILLKDGGHDALALGVGQKLVAVAEQAPGGDQELQLHAAAHGSHGEKLRLAGAQLFHHGAHVVRRHVGDHPLHRLALDPIDLLVEHTGGRDLELIAFPAHGLNEDGQGHLATARHVEGVGGVLHLGDPQGHVLQSFPEQTVPELTAGDELALPPGKGGVVDGEGHLQGGGGDLDKLDGLHGGGGADGVADGDVADAAHGDDLAGGGLGDGNPGQTVEGVQAHRLGLLVLAGGVVVAHGNLLVLLDGAPLNAADGNAAHEVVVVDGGDQHLEGGLGVALGGGDILQNGLEQGHQIGAGHVGRVGGGTLTAGAEEGGGVQLLVGGVQIHQQLQHLVHHLVDALVGAVDLVDDHDDPVAQLQGPGEHEAGLGHGALSGVHQQDDAVDHLQDTLHLTAEVGVARGVHDVDFGVLVVHSGILGQNGDAALPLQVVGVHDPVHGGLILPVDAALLEHLIHQGGLAMVNVGNDGYISQFLIFQNSFPPIYYGKTAWGPASAGRAQWRVQAFYEVKSWDRGRSFGPVQIKMGSPQGVSPMGAFPHSLKTQLFIISRKNADCNGRRGENPTKSRKVLVPH